jgi:hypothetical protein
MNGSVNPLKTPSYQFEKIAFDENTELRFGVVLEDAACLIYEI